MPDDFYTYSDYEPSTPIELPPKPEPPDLTVDRAEAVQENGLWYVQGYRNGALIVKMGGWDTFAETAHATLYNANGNHVTPASPPPTSKERLAVVESALMELAGEIYHD